MKSKWGSRLLALGSLFLSLCAVIYCSKYTEEMLLQLRTEVEDMFNHAYNGYLNYAYPYDELRPITCDGIDTWGSYSLTLIDALDTLAVMGNYTEFQRVVDLVTNKLDFNTNVNVSVFETNIRIVGGLLSAHMLSDKAGISLDPHWPCDGPLLRLAEDVAKRLLPAFDTPTGMPYGTVNLKYGVPPGETTVTCTAGIGTFILEFGTLSKLTGNPVYMEVATNALYSLYTYRSKIGLVGNHIDVSTGVWTAQDSGIGAGVDSYFEYLLKGALLFDEPEFMFMFKTLQESIEKYLKHDSWFFWATMQKGLVTLPVFQSLEAYWPGLMSHVGHVLESVKSVRNYHNVWKQFGFTPEFFNVLQQDTSTNRESYPLRPELVESVMYLYRITGNPYFLDVGVDILRSIERSAKTECGYATIKNCRDHSLDNRMESFFLAETTKYLYLLFDPQNFIHNLGTHGKLFKTLHATCVINTGGYIFNTEAHPIDPGMLECCTPATRYIPESEDLLREKKELDSDIRKLDLTLGFVKAFSSGGDKKRVSIQKKADAFMMKLRKLREVVHEPDGTPHETEAPSSSVTDHAGEDEKEECHTKNVEELVQDMFSSKQCSRRRPPFRKFAYTYNYFDPEAMKEVYTNNDTNEPDKVLVSKGKKILYCSFRPFAERLNV